MRQTSILRRATRLRPVVRSAALALVPVLLIALLLPTSLALGSRTLPLSDVWRGLLAHDSSVPSVIVWSMRMPRTLLAVAVGSSLAGAGALMQGLTRNPLAEPGILGVNAGAALGVVLAISALGLTGVGQYAPFALLGAGCAAAAVYTISHRTIETGSARLVLAGVALSAALSSVTGTITMYNSRAFDSYRFWVVGSLEGRDASVLTRIAPLLLVGLILAVGSARGLNALALGEEQATALGANLMATRASAFLAITLLCGGATAAVGPLSFVGLLVPHAVRLLAGADQRTLIGWSIACGPVLLLAADVAGRVRVRPAELEAGVVTAFVGAPVLLLLAVRRER